MPATATYCGRRGDRNYRTDGGTDGGVLVGVRTTAVVLLAADTRTSRGGVVTSDETRKLEAVHPSAAIGSPGALGDTASVVRELRAEVDRYEDRHGHRMRVPTLATVAGRKLRSRTPPGATFVLGGVDETGSYVFTVGGEEGVLEADYAAEGSGREAAAGVLDRRYEESLSLETTRSIVADALESAVERDARTGPAVDLAEIREGGVTGKRYDSIDAIRP
ncbi:proteasome subunit beta [Natronolimnohabitans sp. A-GB9]|uniref:proteasome subunit beta n=1 Tax=Natronolimnohabitans sp. A-GB9 TaxID=3069757 RepID=UPI0027B49B3D|nr:proteasome subunit beta [Natronolimnohabitans sp. A-GB9]MDQ2052575.1 proteasome subunit beta [Natronolimnohabitans sp. A-GB9]